MKNMQEKVAAVLISLAANQGLTDALKRRQTTCATNERSI